MLISCLHMIWSDWKNCINCILCANFCIHQQKNVRLIKSIKLLQIKENKDINHNFYTWNDSSIGQREGQNADQHFVSQWINKCTKDWTLTFKISSDPTINLIIIKNMKIKKYYIFWKATGKCRKLLSILTIISCLSCSSIIQ